MEGDADESKEVRLRAASTAATASPTSTAATASPTSTPRSSSVTTGTRPSRTGLAAHPARKWQTRREETSALRRDGDHLIHGSGGTFIIIQTIVIIIKIVDSGSGALKQVM